MDTSAVATTADSDFTTTIPLSGLSPETTYYLNVLINGVPQFAAQPFPFFATFAPAGAGREFQFVVLADFGVVTKLTADVQTFASASANLPAFAFIGGDFDHSNPQTLTAKRLMLKNLYNPATRFMSGLVPNILRRMAIVRQWDDHDSGLNNLDKNYPDWSLTQQAFQEYTPTYPLPSVSPGIWQKFDYAQAEYFVLDNRSQRDPGADRDDANKSMLDGNNLGATGELEWLKNGLLNSSAVWKIIFTSVVTNPTTKQNDGWGAYQTEWAGLRTFITTNNIKNVVFIAGDLHLGAIDNGTQAGFPEMCVAAANSTKTGFCATAATGTWSEGYFDDTCPGYGLVTLLQNPDRLVLQVADQDGVIRVAYTVVAELPTPTPTPTPTATPSPTPTPTATPTPSETPTPTATPSPTESPTPTATPTPSETPTPTATPSPTESPTPTATPTPSETPTPTATPSPTESPTPTATPTPSETPTPTATPSPTESPTPTATPTPSETPTPTATPSPTESPTPTATPTPSETPTPTATPSPTESPTPTATPTPSETPTPTATPSPTESPTPTATPTPSVTPTPTPTATPTPSPQGPTIRKQPTNASVKIGQTARFSVKAVGAPPLTYQWKKNGVEIQGATGSSYTTLPTTLADNGALISVRVSNDGGTADSNNATLRVR